MSEQELEKKTFIDEQVEVTVTQLNVMISESKPTGHHNQVLKHYNFNSSSFSHQGHNWTNRQGENRMPYGRSKGGKNSSQRQNRNGRGRNNKKGQRCVGAAGGRRGGGGGGPGAGAGGN